MAPATFKAAWGGRASAKSWFFADLHIHYALERYDGYRALCTRQVQKSLKESLKFLLEQRIEFWGVGDKFPVYDTKIETPKDGEFVFQGLHGQTAESVKSFEGFDVADIEEAHTVRARSLKLLIPTIIRKAGAEVWARWNPRHDTDAIDKFFRGGSPPPNGVIVEVSWRDNPYVSDEIRRQIEADYKNDPETAEHVWGGGYEIISEGAYYARQLAELAHKGQVGDFPHDPERPVITAWDIGVDDYTAIWFLQEDGKSVRVIDYYETSDAGAAEIVAEALPEVAPKPTPLTPRPAPYRYAKHYLPHDVKVREWGGGARERRLVLKENGVTPIIVGVPRDADDRIVAVRSVLPICYFDDNPNVQAGLRRLRNYRRKWNEALQTFQGPLKDGNDHAADAFGEFAVNCAIREPAPDEPKKAREMYDDDDEDDSWMTA